MSEKTTDDSLVWNPYWQSWMRTTAGAERELVLSALMKAQAALNPLSGFLRRRTPKMDRYLDSVRNEIRHAVQVMESNRV